MQIDSRDAVLVMEVGWPTAGKGSESEQRAFIRRLPKLLDPVQVSVVARELLRDVGLAEFDADLNTVVWVGNSRQEKAGLIDIEQWNGAYLLRASSSVSQSRHRWGP